MKPIDPKKAQLLLQRFSALSLGEGDINAGANALAAMALSLSNLLRPDSIALSLDGASVSLGSSFLVTGALSSGVVTDRVVNPLRYFQNNILSHVAHLGEIEARRKKVNTDAGMNIKPGPDGPHFNMESMIEEIQKAGYAADKLKYFQGLLRPPTGRIVSPIREQPFLFATAAQTATVSNLMKTAHAGRPLLHLVLKEQGDGRKFAQVGSEVLDGCTLEEPFMRSVKGNWMITDPGQVMCGPAESKDQVPSWLSRMLWLTDLNDGPGFDLGEASKYAPEVFEPLSAYKAAMEFVLSRRLDEHPYAHTFESPIFNFQVNQSEWIEYLRGMERSLPGITATLRTLPASLYYGLLQIRKFKPEVGRIVADWVLSFSRVLVARMIHAHQRISAERKEAKMEGIVYKLQERLTTFPQKERDIYRPIGIPANDCREGLQVLASRGIAAREGDRWMRVSG